MDKDQAATKRTTTEAKQDNVEPEVGKGKAKPKETGGPKGLEPTRYGDWERKGIAVDF